MLQLYQNRYDETDPSSAEAREACFSPQEMRGPADINRVVVPIVDQQDARRSHATLESLLWDPNIGFHIKISISCYSEGNYD